MSTIEFEDGAICVDAKIIADVLGLAPADVLERMRDGKITSVCERGVDEDAGRFRLTFFHEQQSLRLIVDETGTVIEQTVEHAALRTLRRSGRTRRS